jgi:predicted alpha/beta hydrolase family esterase
MSKSRVVIVHGSFGNVEENWIPYLKDSLIKRGCEVVVPQLPNGDDQNLANWQSIFLDQVGELDENTILVGHSIAPAFLLALLSIPNKKVKAFISVSGFLHDLGFPDFDLVNKTFTHYDFDWDTVKSNVHAGFAFHGVDDPYVPVWMGQEIADLLNVKLEEIPSGGHLNESAGFIEFPILLNKIIDFL